jgi:hypothetical protein
MKQKYSRLLIYVLLVIVFVGGYFLWQEQVVARRPLPEGTKILVKTDYSLCKHEDCKETTPLDLKVLTLRELRGSQPFPNISPPRIVSGKSNCHVTIEFIEEIRKIPTSNQ